MWETKCTLTEEGQQGQHMQSLTTFKVLSEAKRTHIVLNYYHKIVRRTALPMHANEQVVAWAQATSFLT